MHDGTENGVFLFAQEERRIVDIEQSPLHPGDILLSLETFIR